MTCSTCAHYADPSKPMATCSALKLLVAGNYVMIQCGCYKRRTT